MELPSSHLLKLQQSIRGLFSARRLWFSYSWDAGSSRLVLSSFDVLACSVLVLYLDLLK